MPETADSENVMLLREQGETQRRNLAMSAAIQLYNVANTRFCSAGSFEFISELERAAFDGACLLMARSFQECL